MSRRSLLVVFATISVVIAAVVVGHAPAAPAAAQTPHVCDNGTVIPDPTGNAKLVADCKVLLAWEAQLQYSVVDPGLNWTDSSKAITDWEGITVDGDPKRVTGLSLPTNSLVGRLFGNLTDGLGSLTGLTHLDLSRNQMGGSIPTTIGNLTNLVSLDLSENQFSGQIPATIGNLTNLTSLNLANNNLTGSIPAEIWTLTNLVGLRLYSNKGWGDQYGLTGEIPPEVKNLQKLEVLALHINKLSGSIPAEIAELPVLRSLYLYENEFTGSIPSALGDLPKLETLDLRDNQLTRQIPTQLEKLLPELEHLELTHNSFSGCVPARLIEVPYNDIQWLIDLEGLALCGSNTNTNTNTNTAPAISSAVVDGAALTLTYNEPLDETSQPATTAYTVTVETVDRGVTGVVVSGSTVTLTLASAVVGGKAVAVSYLVPEAGPVQDTSGSAAVDLTNERVDNVTNNDPVFTTAPYSFTIDENTRAVGMVLADDVDIQDTVGYRLTPATPPDGGLLFGITNAGDLFFKLPTGADYEHPGSVERTNVDRNVYWATVVATSGTGDRERMTTQQVTVTITNVEEAGELRFSSEQPQVGTALLATVKDPDGNVSGTTWTWEISGPSNTWTTLSSATNEGSAGRGSGPADAHQRGPGRAGQQHQHRAHVRVDRDGSAKRGGGHRTGGAHRHAGPGHRRRHAHVQAWRHGRRLLRHRPVVRTVADRGAARLRDEGQLRGHGHCHRSLR